MKRCLCVVVLVLMVMGCGERVEIQNQAGYVSFVGPHEVSESGREVVTWFGVSDHEGDLLNVEMSLCLASGSCETVSPDVLLPGSVYLESVPSRSDDVSTALKVVWRPPCAFLDADAPFTVTMGVKGSDIEPLASSPQTLDALGVWACSCLEGQTEYGSSSECAVSSEGCYRLSEGLWCSAICPEGYEAVGACAEDEPCLEVTATLLCRERE